jgi:hypothetical protein
MNSPQVGVQNAFTNQLAGNQISMNNSAMGADNAATESNYQTDLNSAINQRMTKLGAMLKQDTVGN